MVLVAPALAEKRLGRSGRDVKLLPYHRFEIISPLKREDALAAIAAHVEAPKWILFRLPSKANDKRFEGQVTETGFNIRRVLGYRNSFQPTVLGEIEGAGAMSRINVTMRPFTFVIVFITIWCAGVLGLTFVSREALLMGAFMLVFLYLLVVSGFWFEANKQERALREIFRAM